MAHFNVYVIHSPKALPELKQQLTESGGFNHAKIIYRSPARTDSVPRPRKEETRKTLVFCPEETITVLKKKYPDYQDHVAPYNWATFPCPDASTGESTNLHVSGLPNDFTVTDAEKFVTETLSFIISEKNESGLPNYWLTFTPRSRETGEINGYGHIVFSSSVPEITIRLCKLALNNIPVYFKRQPLEKRIVTCVWHRKPGSKPVRKLVTIIKDMEAPVQRLHPVVHVDVSNIQPEPLPSVVGNM